MNLKLTRQLLAGNVYKISALVAANHRMAPSCPMDDWNSIEPTRKIELRISATNFLHIIQVLFRLCQLQNHSLSLCILTEQGRKNKIKQTEIYSSPGS